MFVAGVKDKRQNRFIFGERMAVVCCCFVWVPSQDWQGTRDQGLGARDPGWEKGLWIMIWISKSQDQGLGITEAVGFGRDPGRLNFQLPLQPPVTASTSWTRSPAALSKTFLFPAFLKPTCSIFQLWPKINKDIWRRVYAPSYDDCCVCLLFAGTIYRWVTAVTLWVEIEKLATAAVDQKWHMAT